MTTWRRAFPRPVALFCLMVLLVQGVLVAMLLHNSATGRPFAPVVVDDRTDALLAVVDGEVVAALQVDLTGTRDELVIHEAQDARLNEAVLSQVRAIERSQGRTLEVEYVGSDGLPAGGQGNAAGNSYDLTLAASLAGFFMVLVVSLWRGPVARNLRLGVGRVLGLGLLAVGVGAALAVLPTTAVDAGPVAVAGLTALAVSVDHSARPHHGSRAVGLRDPGPCARPVRRPPRRDPTARGPGGRRSGRSRQVATRVGGGGRRGREVGLPLRDGDARCPLRVRFFAPGGAGARGRRVRRGRLALPGQWFMGHRARRGGRADPRRGRGVPDVERLRASRHVVRTERAQGVPRTDVVAWTAPSPTGPFDGGESLAALTSDLWAGELNYMPLAHPDLLPRPGTVVVSDSRNRSDVGSVLEDPLRYRITFLRVELP